MAPRYLPFSAAVENDDPLLAVQSNGTTLRSVSTVPLMHAGPSVRSGGVGKILSLAGEVHSSVRPIGQGAIRIRFPQLGPKECWKEGGSGALRGSAGVCLRLHVEFQAVSERYTRMWRQVRPLC